jgi:hypothetical protein
MSRKLIALVLILSLLVSAIAGTLLVPNATKDLIARGNTVTNSNIIIGEKPDATIAINSPESKIYNTDNITAAFTINSTLPLAAGAALAPFLSYGCLLDYDFSNYSNWENSNVNEVLSRYGNEYLVRANLTGLSEGPHNVTAWVEEQLYYISYDQPVGSLFSTVFFNVVLPPNILILSPETKAYSSSNVPLDFTVNKTVSQISYSLDGQQNVTVTGNTTLTGLSSGLHSITVYANDTFGNMGASETVNFTVAIPQPFPIATISAASGGTALAVVVAGLLVYYKKHKRQP